jgi:hypothetical protein
MDYFVAHTMEHIVARVCDPSHSGCRDRRISSSRIALSKQTLSEKEKQTSKQKGREHIA